MILDVLEGPRKGQLFTFNRHDTFIVGRSRFVHCAMPEDSALSRDHFMIEIHPPRCEIRDLGSTNGTFVNDHRVDRARLKSGDLIAAGSSLFRVRVEAPLIEGETSPPSTQALPARSLTVTLDAPAGSSTGALKIATLLRCNRCDLPAPRDLEIHADVDEPVEWTCSLCKADTNTLPQPVPHYKTIRELGRGAMGVVYQAKHATTGRMVALKLIGPESAAAQGYSRRFSQCPREMPRPRSEGSIRHREGTPRSDPAVLLRNSRGVYRTLTQLKINRRCFSNDSGCDVRLRNPT